MNNETLNINKENVLNAYGSATDEQKAMLEIIFGKDTFKPKDITERIKTFKDACKELGSDHPLVLAYQHTNLRDAELANDNKDIIAYMKLRIICAALNEGWKPKFSENECRWYPWLYLYTEKELAEKSEDWKKRHALIELGDKYKKSAYAGLACAYSNNAPSFTTTTFSSRLCLKSEALATYCGKQFIELWADFYLTPKSNH